MTCVKATISNAEGVFEGVSAETHFKMTFNYEFSSLCDLLTKNGLVANY